MTEEEILNIAGEIWNSGSSFPIPSSDDILRFASLLAAEIMPKETLAAMFEWGKDAGRVEEREACAKTAMEFLFTYIGSYPINEQFADAIRARGQA